jgi:hypothetical protein
MMVMIESIKTEEAVLFLLNLTLCEIKGKQVICFHILYPGHEVDVDLYVKFKISLVKFSCCV